MSKLTIEYFLDNHGWADVRFSDGKTHCESSASYLHDSLDQLADMALDLKHGVDAAFAVFVNEPGETQFVVNITNNEAFYELRQLDDWQSWGKQELNWEKQPHENYRVLLKGNCSPHTIVSQIHNQLRRIHDEIGVVEYKKRWQEHEFPLEKYQLLEKSHDG